MSRRMWLIVGLICGALVVGILGGLLLSKSKADAAGEWGKSLLTLFVAILISGLLALILSDYSQRQQQRDADREQASSWLRSLVEANNRVNAAVLLLNANKGATIHGEQTRNLIQARVMLRSLQEDLEVFQPPVAVELGKMIEYLTRLGDEYRENYYRLTWAQNRHEEFIKRQMSQPDLPEEPIEDVENPWRVLQIYFPKVVGLLEHDDNYKKDYSDHYHKARDLLRERLATFGTRQPEVKNTSLARTDST